MRIRWTSVHSVVAGNPSAPWVGPGLAERLKREAEKERSKTDKKTTMSERALNWFRRSR
jgi:hypothetical protein